MAPADAQMVTIGVVVKPQGRHGEVAVEPLTDVPERFPGLRISVAEEDALVSVRAVIGKRIGVASTKAYTAQVLVFNLLSLYIAQVQEMPGVRVPEVAAELLKLPAYADQTLAVEEKVKLGTITSSPGWRASRRALSSRAAVHDGVSSTGAPLWRPDSSLVAAAPKAPSPESWPERELCSR